MVHGDAGKQREVVRASSETVTFGSQALCMWLSLVVTDIYCFLLITVVCGEQVGDPTLVFHWQMTTSQKLRPSANVGCHLAGKVVLLHLSC